MPEKLDLPVLYIRHNARKFHGELKDTRRKEDGRIAKGFYFIDRYFFSSLKNARDFKSAIEERFGKVRLTRTKGGYLVEAPHLS